MAICFSYSSAGV